MKDDVSSVDADYGDFEPVIGLEVHAQMLTESKLFCGCSTRFGGEPNTHTCPVCMGMPGVLPLVNPRAVELALEKLILPELAHMAKLARRAARA